MKPNETTHVHMSMTCSNNLDMNVFQSKDNTDMMQYGTCNIFCLFAQRQKKINSPNVFEV